MDNQQHYIEELENMVIKMKNHFDALYRSPQYKERIKEYSDATYLSFETLRMAHPTPYTMECSLDILKEDNPKLECY